MNYEFHIRSGSAAELSSSEYLDCINRVIDEEAAFRSLLLTVEP